MAETGRGRLVMNRRRLLLETRQLSLQVGDQHVRHVVGEPAPDDDSKSGKIFAVLRERVRGHLPATLAKRVRHVEHGEVLDVVPKREREDGQLVAPRDELERPELGDLRGEPRRDVAGVLLDPGVAIEPEPDEVVVLRDNLRRPAARS